MNDERFSLRRRRLGRGYRRRDVEDVLARLTATVHALEVDLDQLKRRAAELEHELATAHEELGRFRLREERIADLLLRAEEALSRVEALTAQRPAGGTTIE